MRFKKFDMNLLVALDALLAERSVSKAAARLNLSPSATSDALARLRQYFDDPLLVQVGKRMEPTGRAEQLKDAVRELLAQMDHTISAQPDFDPSTSDRQFRIYASDYTQFVLGPRLMAAAAAQRCTAVFDFLPQVAEPQRDLERGDADLLILPGTLMSAHHPQTPLHEEGFVCAVWRGGELAQGRLTRERYLAAGHVLMRPQAAPRESSYEEGFMQQSGLQRRVAATSYGFATVAGLLVGTNLVATMHASLARQLCQLWPLNLRPCPIEIPPMMQSMQWHRARTQDPGLAWLRALTLSAATKYAQDETAQTPRPGSNADC